MLARNPLVPSPTTALDRPLAVTLDAVLKAMPGVAAVGLDPAVEALIRPLRLPAFDLVCRRVRFADGLRLTVVAVPGALWRQHLVRVGLATLQRAAAAIGRDVVLVPASRLDHDPHRCAATSEAAEAVQDEAEDRAPVAGGRR